MISGRHCHLLALAALIGLPVSAQDRDTGWRDDLLTVAVTIREKHPNPYTKVSAEDFDRAVSELHAAIPSLTDAQVKAGIARVAALAGDAHTSLSLSQSGAATQRYPLKLRWFDDGLFIIAAPLSLDAHIGAKVITIAGVPAEEAHQRLLPFISYENDPWAREISQDYMTYPEWISAAGILTAAGPLTLGLERADGRAYTLDVAASSSMPAMIDGPRLARPLFPLWKRNPAAPYWFDYLADSRTVYFKYNQCTESPALPMQSFAQQAGLALIDQAFDRVVFDLRDNGGGNSAVLEPLLDGLFGGIQAGQWPVPKGVWAIVGRKTFSSAVLNAASLKARGAMLVGEPTGGNPSWFGEVKSIRLPNSRLNLIYSTRKFDVPGFPGPFVDVDVRVPFTSADYFADRDPWLEAALTASKP